MAGLSEQSIDPKRTIVVLNFPSNVGEDELTIHFQKEKNGGGDVDDVVVDASVAFVTFDLAEVATSVLDHPEQVINGSKIEVQGYESWLANKKKQERSSVVHIQEDNSQPEDAASAVKTIYVSDIKDSTTEDSITLFFENKKRSGGGDLCEGKEGYKRLSATVARLTYVSSKDAQNVLTKANKTPLILEGNVLKVSTVFEPTHDRSILLAKNLNSRTKEETFRSFVEVTKSADVFNVVFGKDGKAIVILKTEIDSEVISEDTRSSVDMKLDGSVISLEFAPLTKGIRISNIPPETSSDDMRFKFSNKKIGGGPVTDMMLDKKNGVANVYFEKSSVVSELVKKEHTFKDVPLTVIPYYDNFEELQAMTTKTTAFSGDYHIDPLVIAYVINHGRIDEKFDLKAMKFDESSSRFHFTKEFEDSKDATEFTNKLKEFLHSFVKEEVKIAKALFERVKEAIEGKRDEFDADVVEFSFDRSRVIFVGQREDVAVKKQLVEAMVDTFTEAAQKESTDFQIADINKLKFLNFIDYFKKLETEFPEVQIRGMESSSGELSLLGTKAKTKDVKIKIFEDLMKISEIDVKMSDRQIDFLKRTECQIVNDELKNDDVMLMLVTKKGAVGAKGLEAKIFALKKCDDHERLVNIVYSKTSEECKKLDEETAKFLAKSDKLQEFKKEQFDQHHILIDPELADPCNIWIVCEKSKMKNAENELASLTDEKKITSCTFKPMEPMKVRFLKEHCWARIKEKENQKSCKVEGVAVLEIDSGSLEVKGTKAGRKEMIIFLEKLAANVSFKAYPLTEPGMKKQMSMEATTAIISKIEKSHKCVIEKDTQPKETREEAKDATVIADGGTAAGAGGPSTMNLPYHSMSFVNDNEVKMASGQRITIVVGDLAHQKRIDVIVNTTNEKVDLNGNPCGKALLKVAGKELLNECRKIGSLNAGEMALTGPAKLSCKRVYHVRTSHWDNGKGDPVLRQLIKKCLDQMEKDKFTSIAIPAIGTGNLHFPRPQVAKIFFEEVTGYLTANPQSAINDIRFVGYGKDQPTVDAFLGAVQEIKSMVLSPPRKSVPVSIPRKNTPAKVPGLSNVTTSEKPDGSLELSLGSRNLTVQIVCADISKETTNLIMHVTSEDFSFNGGVGKALIKAGGDSIVQECKALGQPALFTTQYTKAGNLPVNQIAHVIGPGKPTYAELKQCLDNFFDDVIMKNIAKVSFSAIGAGAMGYSESQSADLIFDNLSRIAESQNPALNLARVVIFEKAKFNKFKDASKAYFASGGATSPSPQPTRSRFTSVFRSKRAVKTKGEDGGTSIKIYSDDRGKIDKAWGDLKRQVCQSIKDQPMNDEVIKKFTDRDLEKLRKLERDFDVKINVEQKKGSVKIKGHLDDVSTVQEEIRTILKDITENEPKVPDYWDSTLIDGKFYKVNLPTTSKEYQDVETAFHTTSPNQIVRIERIQNREIYEIYEAKRQAMMKKYGGNFAGKELRLFHGTSVTNIEKINSDGLNRNYAGIHATALGRGVYFARDAIYSCNHTYSPADPLGFRYMYYAKVLVGEYTLGAPTMLVPPVKDPVNNPNESFDSVVDRMNNPGIYVLFKDYEYYTEYLITFK